MARVTRVRPGRTDSGRGPGALFRRLYGESPLQLLVLLASFALTGYAGIRLLDGDRIGILMWFVGAALLHDLVLLPAYAIADRALQAALGPRRAQPGRWINHVRVPAFVSLLLLAVYWPLVLADPEEADHFERTTQLASGTFLGRWLLITAGLFGASALWLVVRLCRDRAARAAER